MSKTQATEKNYRSLPDYDGLVAKWLGNYDKSNYGSGLAATVLKRTHSLIEKPFGPDVYMSQVLEIGAGTLAHLPFVRHRFSRYIASDFDLTVLDVARKQVLPPGVELMQLDGSGLPFEPDSFDRLIATHVLEHVIQPHAALEEWVRVIKPGGVLSIILPCDPGLAWRLGRFLGPRKQATESGLPYDYYMAREHINSINNLANIINYHFPKKTVTWWPLWIASTDLNLIQARNIDV